MSLLGVVARTGRPRRGALDRAQDKKAREGGQPKNHRRLAPGKIRCGAHKFVYRLVFKVLGITLKPIGDAAKQPSELRSIGSRSSAARFAELAKYPTILAPFTT